ncbi:MAG: 16S rRNA (guanine(966)-N(2))-methyltransferase RsmD [Pyrinomonadaceae bacterium]
MQVRPTSDRLRETLFNVIAPRIEGARFLDLCAGSGAVGIEALSRGAAYGTFVDRSRRMCRLIESNLHLCLIPENETEIVQAEVVEFLRRAANVTRNKPWDIAFYDPPYATDYLQVLELFGRHTDALLAEDCLLIVEHHHKKTLEEEVGDLHRRRILKQGDSALSFYENKSTDEFSRTEELP